MIVLLAASVPWPGLGVGARPAMAVSVEEVFGDALEFDRNDLLEGHYERVVQAATELNIPGPPCCRSAGAARSGN